MSDGVWFEEVIQDANRAACAVCRVGYAVLDPHTGHLHPCITCQLHGWRLKQRRWWRGWKRHGF